MNANIKLVVNGQLKYEIPVCVDNPDLEDDVEPDVAYLSLCRTEVTDNENINKTVRLQDLIGSYKGADIFLDFNQNKELVGLELLF